MRNDFCAFILTHGRADNVKTLPALDKCGYTGKWFLVVDDEDEALADYRKRYGDRVLVFSKSAIAERFDQGDTFSDRRAIFWARNACWELAEKVGCRYFVELDDDYSWFGYRWIGKRDGDTRPKFHGWIIRSIDEVFEALVEFLDRTKADTVAFAQGGDYMGGGSTEWCRRIALMRKAMNSFVCDATRPFDFVGRINEDVNTYVSRGRTGKLFFTFRPLQLNQEMTQSGDGGMTDLYLDGGTFLKSFYTVMYAPSCARISTLGRMNHRLHHKIDWNATAPKIVREELRKAT
jgi:hypothetical protein